MLTTEDRRWLTGEKSYDGQHAKQQRYQRRRDIRERVYNSILDFTILFDQLDEDEHEQIFGAVSDDGRQWANDDADLREGVRDGLAFLFYTVGVTAMMRERSSPQVPQWLIESAVQQAGRREGYLVEDVDIDVDATDVAVPDILAELESGADVSPAELYHLVESDAVDSETVAACLREQMDDRGCDG